jgi:hypothetical protein
MTNRWDAWKAQEPPADFAARTVAAALAERAQRRRARRLAGRRAVVACAMAAVMVASVAWGYTAWKTRAESSERARPAPIVVAQDARSATTPPPALSSFVPSPPASAEVPLAPIAAPPPIRRKIDAASLPDVGRKVMRPQCECSPHEEMCTCF